jgi:hypothetical protein
MIKNMSLEELAKFLICDSIEEEMDYDWDENPYTITYDCYVTPFLRYPHYWNYEDVLNDTVRILSETGKSK